MVKVLAFNPSVLEQSMKPSEVVKSSVYSKGKGKGCDNCYSALLYLRHSHENKLLNWTGGEKLIKIAI